MSVTLTPVDAGDSRLRAALGTAGLPTADLDTAAARFFAAADADGPIGWGGLEGEGSDRLLRSLVVVEGGRGQGRGRALLAALETEARRTGARRLWLLTTSAADFFAAAGWRRVDRSVAPAAIAATSQFATLCPASAVCLARDLAAS